MVNWMSRASPSNCSVPVAPSGDGCVECLAMGASWLHLRRCIACGHVGCSDSSPNKHATAHFHATRDPLIQSLNLFAQPRRFRGR